MKLIVMISIFISFSSVARKCEVFIKSDTGKTSKITKRVLKRKGYIITNNIKEADFIFHHGRSANSPDSTTENEFTCYIWNMFPAWGKPQNVSHGSYMIMHSQRFHYARSLRKRIKKQICR